MKLLLALMMGLFAGASAPAQSPASVSSGTGKEASRAAIEGVVVKEPGSEPVKKVLIELIAENQAEGGDYTAVTAADGTFRIEGISAGRYHLFAERTGLLEVQKHHPAPQGRVLTIASGEELKDVQIRLQAAAVVRGRVTDEDGDPMAGAQVSVMRQTFSTGHSRWEQVQSERTNDLGEYRVANLPAGSYYVSVSPPPDFRAFVENTGTTKPAGQNTVEKPDTSYQPVYYPGTTDRSQATPLPLRAGDDFPLDFSLTPSPSLSIRGTVVNLPPRTAATIMLQSHDFNMVLTATEVHKDGSFVIRDVAPGAYTILASVENSRVPMMARQSLQVVSSSVEGLRLAPQSGGTIRGRVRIEARANQKVDVGQVVLLLTSAIGDADPGLYFNANSTAFTPLAHVAPDGSFEWKDVPPGKYTVQADVNSDDGGTESPWFVKSVALDGREIAEGIVSVEGSTISLDVLASANSAVLSGIVADKGGQPVANAVVVAVPEATYRARVDRFHKTVTDQNGRFELRGVPPGDYSLFAWESLESDAYYDPEFLRKFQPEAVAVRAGEGERKTVALQVISDSEDQP
jgi:Carboxypeptidase regulatory-like domain